MFTVEILKAGVWEQASSHTLAIDAEAQKAIFLADGIAEEAIRMREDNNGQA